MDVKIVVQVRLYPDAAQEAALRATLDLCNEAANLASTEAFQRRIYAKQALQRLTYGRLKAMGLSAQPAIHVARKVAGAYATLKATIRAGNLGKPGSKRRRKAEGKPIRFRRDAAQPFDDRCLSWRLADRTVSIWAVGGRLNRVRFGCSAQQYATLVAHRRGESDLVHRDGKWFLYATCDIPDVEVKQPEGFLGVDLGIANIATTNDGTRHSGKGLNRVRHRNQRLRAKLQRIGTKSAKRLLKARRRKEARFAADTNHRIAKQIVTEAERTGRGIALENLSGIRDRVRLRRPQRVTLHTWAFHQLGQFIAYKAARAGLALVHVNPAYTSQGCSTCGHIAKANRPNQSTFRCTSCGFAEHADVNAARNIATRGIADWAAASLPNAA
ncbi:transposase [Micromonospora sp. DR5-3]|uniref:RNA-guided endonuclease InsQ/TnpB family protein n=1 Tax=unclassified Micromonospora TaxID=2617518 RepID=UPI0011D67E69|nr:MULTISPECIES: RNA-guided endonuclease TnpB family protein [unclassified Micromonospora]MCW3820788.1 transposase [Micromonospora sp. DR5-3]TYC19138.1 IS200/IS605 family element transposase accessory protein TnpB [Micromonospora sp. MP36]